MDDAATIAARLGLKRIGREYRGACPACGYKSGLTVADRGSKPVWHCKACGDQSAVSAAIFGGAAAMPSSAPPEAAGEDRRALALAMWERALPATGSPVETYLRGRGLVLPGEVGTVCSGYGAPLRHLAHAKHPSGPRFSVMAALVVDVAGLPIALHRTFLAPGGAGKAAVEPQRMTLGPVKGGAVRLFPVAAELAIGEGIETTIAASILLGLPAWAATSAGNLADALALPPEVRDVVVVADHDAPGLAAARRAGARWKAEGRRVRLARPDRPGDDFADVLARRVPHG